MDNLEVEQIFLYCKENSVRHKTDKYEVIHDENPIPILRRGEKFTLAVQFTNRDFDFNTDNLRLIFNYGPKPNAIKGTRGILRVDYRQKEIDSENQVWTVNVLNIESNAITLEAFTPPSIPIGLWGLQVETSLKDYSTEPSVFDYENDLYFLCNPWNCHDLVFMPETRLLDEYVLTDVGKIWVGPLGTCKGREWVFGQFDACVLPAIMIMFEKSGLPHHNRGDPIKLTRMFSKMVNAKDDDGILVGGWNGEYDDGTAPSAWTGSVPILQEFLDTEAPVSYGQCWVFSGVITTICRALGIPSRVVSNLVSAHDANATLTVDKYYNASNEEIDYDPNNENGEDSIWNYHVWNDVYMARPDLPPGYGGWQAIDATPQETSSGFYQCGPASVEAIKNGQVGYNYDVPFMVATVNADLMRWKEDRTCDLGYSKIFCNKYHIGRFILTKQPFLYDYNGDRDREDITLLYKAKEGTDAERLSLLNAVRGSEAAKIFFQVPDAELEDMEFELEELERIKIGEDFCVVVNLRNNSDEVRTIEAALSAGSAYYNGVKAHQIDRAEGKFNMKPHSTERLQLTITADQYLDKLVEYCIMKIYAIATVVETRQTWADEDDFQVIKPPIEIKVPEEIPLQEPSTITLQFTNPLKRPLTRCCFNLSGPSLVRNQVIPYCDVEPEELVRIEASIVPRLEGEQKVVATFVSRELQDITGSAKVEVVGQSCFSYPEDDQCEC